MQEDSKLAIALKLLLSIILMFSVVLLSVAASENINSSRKYKQYNRSEPKEIETLYGLEINFTITELDREEVIDFYTSYTNNKKISESILKWSLCYNAPVNIAFAIAHTENMGFKPKSVSKPNANGSRDWGLFQLNDGFRVSWTREDFFNIDKNAKEGIKHYSESYGSYIEKGLEFTLLGYNMGITGAEKYDEVPNHRKEYVNKILSYAKELDEAFTDRFAR